VRWKLDGKAACRRLQNLDRIGTRYQPVSMPEQDIGHLMAAAVQLTGMFKAITLLI
jgi:hypothetical protein